MKRAGSNFDDFLREEELLADVEGIAALRYAELERDAIAAASDPEQQADADWWTFTTADGLDR